MNKPKNDRYQFILSTIVSAGIFLLQERDSGFSTEFKHGDRRNLVTSVDKSVDLFIHNSIKESYPSDTIYSEEQIGNIHKEKKSFWTIDPIDGTSNFARNIPHFAVSIGFIEDGICTVGAVYNPVTHELFSFERGKGAFLNKAPIRVSATIKLQDAYIILHIGRSENVREWGLSLQKKFLEFAKKTINLSSSALDLCFIASNKVDVTVYGTLTTLDCAPAIGIVREAGGEVYDDSGNPVLLTALPQKVFACCTRSLFEQVI